MLRQCTKSEFEKYMDFAYRLACDPSKSGYPTYCDGIKTKEMFIERSHQAFERDDEFIFLFEYGGAVQGMIHCFAIPEDRYISTAAFGINTGTIIALSEFLEFVGKRFPGYDLFLGFPAENRDAVVFLSEHGFECVEDDFNNTAHLDSIEAAGNDLVRVDRENFGSFRKLHRAVENEMYWNSDRILADLDNWAILLREEGGEPRGAVYYTASGEGCFEIFGVDTDRYDPGLYGELLKGALSDAKVRGGRFMTFFCDREYENIAEECGFMCVGKYLCFKKHL